MVAASRVRTWKIRPIEDSLTCISMVGTEMATDGFEELAKKGVDLRPFVITPEDCARKLLRVVSAFKILQCSIVRKATTS